MTAEETENERSDDKKHLGEDAAPTPRVRPRPVSEQFPWGTKARPFAMYGNGKGK